MNSNSEGHEFETHIVDWMNKENNVNEVEKVSTNDKISPISASLLIESESTFTSMPYRL